MQVIVRDNNVEQAHRVLKKKLQREGVLREVKMKRFFEKPSEKRAREKAESLRRARKFQRKKREKAGYLQNSQASLATLPCDSALRFL